MLRKIVHRKQCCWINYVRTRKGKLFRAHVAYPCFEGASPAAAAAAAAAAAGCLSPSSLICVLVVGDIPQSILSFLCKAELNWRGWKHRWDVEEGLVPPPFMVRIPPRLCLMLSSLWGGGWFMVVTAERVLLWCGKAVAKRYFALRFSFFILKMMLSAGR